MFELDPEGWRKLTVRWALFFLALALANEVVWRTQTTEFWLGFKAATVVFTFAFAAAQFPLLKRHAPPGGALHEKS
jgi:intracellular septation protein